MHRLAPRDPLRRLGPAYESELAEALLPETAVPLELAEKILAKLA